jgi:hypothetical protein
MFGLLVGITFGDRQDTFSFMYYAEEMSTKQTNSVALSPQAN